MRYIKKGEEPPSMKERKVLQKNAGLPLAYRDFRDKQGLNAALIKEQHSICCYCEKRLDHFQGQKERGAHNEHLIPESGPSGEFDKQMDYNNLYACCIESQGMPKNKTHCGEHKKDGVIYPFIQKENCAEYFRYNTLGEIIPNGDYPCWDDYLSHRTELLGMVKEAVDAIELLNLNCNSLVADRNVCLVELMRWTVGKDKQSIRDKMLEFENSSVFPEFIDMCLYFMEKKLEK